MKKTAQKIPATGRDGQRLIAPGEGPYAEIELLDPDRKGTGSYEIVPGVVTRLTGNVRRLTAANPGYMTGPGTNTYIVGDEESGVAVIDPGPLRADHMDRLIEVAGNIGWIFVTHTHPDHSPAATILKEKTGAPLI